VKKGKVRPLKLHVGEAVEVRSASEIFATLDDQGAVDGLPFMPEMLDYCGKRFRVEKRADKTCNTITVVESRRLHDTVHLEALRCNGEAHGGCQAQCLLFWKEAWLKRVDEREDSSQLPLGSMQPPTSSLVAPQFDAARLHACTKRVEPSSSAEVHYRCQATDLLKASKPLPWWDLRQYFRDVHCGNVGLMDGVRALLFRLFLKTLKLGAYRAQLWTYNHLQSLRGGTPYPYVWGTLDKTFRALPLDLKPGELVQVKSYKEILETLNKKNRNLGLSFDPEMVPYCGSVRRVRARVEHIINERTGKMMTFSNDCLILEGAICRAEYSDKRLFCPRSIFPFWREDWLKRVEKTTESKDATEQTTPESDVAAQRA
jgi:hypothetical protein